MDIPIIHRLPEVEARYKKLTTPTPQQLREERAKTLSGNPEAARLERSKALFEFSKHGVLA